MIKASTELDILITMIQCPSKPLLGCNFEMYKDEVTFYRERLLKQALKTKRRFKKAGLI